MMVFFTILLVCLAAIHVTWALGIWWPLGDEARLTRAVVGMAKGVRMPGPIPLALVAVFLLFAAVWPWLFVQSRAPFGVWGIWALAAVFLMRGACAYLSFWTSITPEQPYRRNDRLFYGPMCLIIGVYFIIISGG
jgi:hypothetical protein